MLSINPFAPNLTNLFVITCSCAQKLAKRIFLARKRVKMMTKKGFSKEEALLFHRVFEEIDEDGNGKIDAMELHSVMVKLGEGERCDASECVKFVREVDRDGNGVIEFNEFIDLVKQVGIGQDHTNFGALISKLAAAKMEEIYVFKPAENKRDSPEVLRVREEDELVLLDDVHLDDSVFDSESEEEEKQEERVEPSLTDSILSPRDPSNPQFEKLVWLWAKKRSFQLMCAAAKSDPEENVVLTCALPEQVIVWLQQKLFRTIARETDEKQADWFPKRAFVENADYLLYCLDSIFRPGRNAALMTEKDYGGQLLEMEAHWQQMRGGDNSSKHRPKLKGEAWNEALSRAKRMRASVHNEDWSAPALKESASNSSSSSVKHSLLVQVRALGRGKRLVWTKSTTVQDVIDTCRKWAEKKDAEKSKSLKYELYRKTGENKHNALNASATLASVGIEDLEEVVLK